MSVAIGDVASDYHCRGFGAGRRCDPSLQDGLVWLRIHPPSAQSAMITVDSDEVEENAFRHRVRSSTIHGLSTTSTTLVSMRFQEITLKGRE